MEKYHVLRTRQHLLTPVYWNGVSQTSNLVLNTHGVTGKKTWMLFQGKNMTMFYLQEEWNRIGELLLKKVLDEREYIKSIYSLQHEAGLELAKLSEEIYLSDLSEKNPKELVDLAKSIRSDWLKHDGLNVFPWAFLGDFLSAYLQRALEKNPKFSLEAFHVLLSPSKKSFTLEEELIVTETALDICESGERNIFEGPLKTVFDKLSEESKGKILSLAKKYYWIPFGYEGPTVWGKEHYLEELKNLVSQGGDYLSKKMDFLKNFEKEITKKQKKAADELGITPEQQSLFEELHTLALMTDERKEFTFRAHVAIHTILKEIANRLKIPFDDVRQVTIDELSSLLSWPEKIQEVAKRRTNSTFVVVCEKGDYRVIEGKQAEEIEAEFLSTRALGKELSGSVASKGSTAITKGVAKVLLSSNEVGKVKQGEILVATMTTPDFVPAMRKAAAIVTDEGGVTCHAAIVSRELGIPCVIGTKAATKEIKDGDVILVDTEKGTVKKLAGA